MTEEQEDSHRGKQASQIESQNAHQDVGDLAPDPSSSVDDDSDSPPPSSERKTKRRRDEGGSAGHPDRVKRSKKERKARRRLERKTPKKLGKGRQKRGHGIAVIGDGGLPTPTQGAFPTHLAVMGDDQEDWNPPDGRVSADAPWIPDPMDDSPDPVDEAKQAAKKAARKETAEAKGAKEAKRAEKKAEVVATKESRKKAMETKKKAMETKKKAANRSKKKMRYLHILPAEVRLIIYRDLLVADKPILVHGGWRLVFKRQRSTRERAAADDAAQTLRLSPAILRTCRLMYAEAVGILYGANTFLYRLRDPTSAVTDASRLVHVDSVGGNEDDDEDGDGDGDADDQGTESGSDWQQDCTMGQEASRRQRRTAAKKTQVACDIDVDKHLGLFRRVAIEAEHNRFSPATMRAMAKAIYTFAPRPDAPFNAPSQPNLRTLIVRVAPLRDDTGFTFVDFFAPTSPVTRAVQAVCCRFLRVDLMTRYMDDCALRAGCSLNVDRRCEMLCRRDRESWRDVAIQQARERSALRSIKAISTLGQSVAKFCSAYVHGVAGGLTAMQYPWDQFDDGTDEGF